MQIELEERLKEHNKLKRIYEEENGKRNEINQDLDKKEKYQNCKEEREELDEKIDEKLQINIERIIMIIDKRLKQEFEYIISFT